jgi:hypothetical protein
MTGITWPSTEVVKPSKSVLSAARAELITLDPYVGRKKDTPKPAERCEAKADIKDNIFRSFNERLTI